MARRGDLPHGDGPGSGVVVVQRSEEVFDGEGRLVGSVERHLVEEVVGDVSAPDLVVEEVEDPVRAVDGGDGTLDPRPLVVTVLRNGGIGVLEPRVEDEPRVGPQVRAPVPEGDGEEPVLEAELEEEPEAGEDTESAERDLHCHLVGEHSRRGPEVVCYASEARTVDVELAGGREAEEVERPAEDEVAEDLEERRRKEEGGRRKEEGKGEHIC